jgi:hypothetical protein
VSADEIEFFISDEPPEELSQREEMGGEPRRRPPFELSRSAGLAALLLAAAAALPTVASFQGVYTIRERGGGVRSATNGTDGWGRYRVDSPDVPSGIHEIRYGIPLVVCAGVLAVLAVALVMTLVGRRDTHTQRRAQGAMMLLALAATSVLGGVAATMWLHIQALFDTIHAQLDTIGSGLGGSPPTIETGIGACLWLTLAGVVAGLLAVGALWRSARAGSGANEEPGKLG